MFKSRFCHRKPLALASAMLFSLGSAAYAQGHEGHHRGHQGHGMAVEQVIAQVKDRLALDSSQQLMFDNAVAATKAARQAGRAEMHRMADTLRAELAKAEPDLAAVAAAADAAQSNGQAVRKSVREQWLRLYATFSPSQKAVVRDVLAQRLERHEKMRAKMRERFSGGQG
jgi:hypothetical protein